MKCDICGTKIQNLFLEKIRGTFVRKGGKKKVVCAECQSKLTDAEIKEKL